MNHEKYAEVLTNEKKQILVNVAMDYLNQERDLRGFVAGKGWAHAVAHGADFLSSVVEQSIENEKSTLTEVLEVIKSVILRTESVFVSEESDRLANVILAVMKYHRSQNELVTYFIDKMNDEFEPFDEFFDSAPAANWISLLKSAYFKLKFEIDDNAASDVIYRYLEEHYREYGSL